MVNIDTKNKVVKLISNKSDTDTITNLVDDTRVIETEFRMTGTG